MNFMNGFAWMRERLAGRTATTSESPTGTQTPETMSPTESQLSALEDYHPVRELPVVELNSGEMRHARCAARFVTPEARKPSRTSIEHGREGPFEQCYRSAKYLIGENVYCKVHAQMLALPAAIQLNRDLEELQSTFDLRWDADMRAIKRWQEATGEELTWPDHADLVVWLMEQLENEL